jgi:hypothetical protein
VRANAFTDEQLTSWESDPIGTCEQIFPGSARLVRRYNVDISRRPSVVEQVGAADIGYQPSRHFGTFLSTLADLDRQGIDPAQTMR